VTVQVLTGDCIASMAALPVGTFQTCVTSPPYYGLRDYGVAGQIGLEESPDAYVARLVDVFREVRRALRDDGTLWLNLGDSYAQPIKGTGGTAVSGSLMARKSAEGAARTIARQKMAARRVGMGEAKPKDLLGIPWMVAFAMRADGWFLRSAIVWAKPNPMPESVRDRPTNSYEMVFLLTKAARYCYDAEAIAEPVEESTVARLAQDVGAQAGSMRANGGAKTNGPMRAVGGATRNARNVWTIATQPYSGAHFATMPPDLAERCIKAGSKPGDHVLDPFGGAGTTALVADRLGRHATICELNPEYARLARERITADAPLLATVA
jgi:DNA modification methylase